MNTKVLSRIATVAAAGALMAGCAAPQHPDPRDPWEGFNRGVYKFNDTVDRAVFKPVAPAYTCLLYTSVLNNSLFKILVQP